MDEPQPAFTDIDEVSINDYLMRFLSMIMSFMNIKVLVFLAECSRNGQRVSGSMSML